MPRHGDREGGDVGLSLAELDNLAAAARKDIADAPDLAALHELDQLYLGKRSRLSEIQRLLGNLDLEARQALGLRLNEAKTDLRRELVARRAALEARREAKLMESERLDVTLPGRVSPRGAIHPVTRTADEVVDIFIGLGYRVAEGPEVETDWHNFQALNIPLDHPARSMQDSLYLQGPTLGSSLLLRTQTSSVQIRAMMLQPPPLYIVSPGRCYRMDTPDTTHIPVFNQVEILAVDEGITMGDLKGTLVAFIRAYFGESREIRLRPSYFPFTEPSAEVDVSCFRCDGRGGDCSTCKGEGWIELLGCGMVHPNVLANAGYDPDRVSGFAAGMGVERLFLLRSGLADVRALLNNDVRWLSGL